MKRRYGIAISAMILAVQFSGPVDAADPSIEQLERIATLLDSNDVGGMRDFLRVNPDLMEGGTELALLLRQYMDESNDPIDFIGFPRELLNGVGAGDPVPDRRASLPDATGPQIPPPPRAAQEPDIALY